MKKLVLVSILFNLQFVIAQNFNFGKISKEELKERFNVADSSASASYLYKYRKTSVEYFENEGFQLITEIHERIKLYNKDGFEYATKKINLYKDARKREKVGELKAYTYNLVDDKIEDSKLKGEGEFDIELSEYYNQKTFTMPNVKEGSVIEYKYKVKSPFVSIVDEFKFQHSIPVKKLVAIFMAPEYFNYKLNMKGFLPISAKQEIIDGDIDFHTKTRSSGSGFSSVKTNFNTSKLRFDINKNSYELTDVPALKNEPFVNNIDNYRSSVKYELSFTKFPNSNLEYYSTTWEDVVKTIYKRPEFGGELNRIGYYQKDLDALLADSTDPLEKIAKIFDKVKSQVKWNGYYGKYATNGVRQAYKEGTGNVGDINLMLTSMLRSAGLNSKPILISTRDNGIPIFPTREGYNYVISGVVVDNDTILLDATNAYSSLNVLPLRALNWEGRMINKDGSSVMVDLYPKNNAQETVYLNVELGNNGGIEGMVRRTMTGHDAMSYRKQFNSEKEDVYIEELENKYGEMTVSDFEVRDNIDLAHPVMESYKFVTENHMEMIGDRIYFSPMFFLGTKENPFKLEKREFPVDFGYPSSTMYRIGIAIPEGYIVESLPESIRLKLPDELGSFLFNVATQSNQISLLVNTRVNQSVIAPLYYSSLREYFKLVVDKMSEKIVLTKNKE